MAGADPGSTAMGWRIERVGADHLEQVAELLGWGGSRAWSRESIARALGEADSWSRWVLANVDADADLGKRGEGSAVAVMLARRVSDLLEIDQLVVRPEARRRGIARALLQDALTRARVEDLQEIRLELARHNTAAGELYAGLGFVVVGERARYYPDGDDALLLSATPGCGDESAGRGRSAAGRRERRTR